ncbi:MAG: thiol:disulfide interchange protein DsbA/DsbL [Legionellaceae bacterium]|nr:thiol:disulfide interchange protein DsbA/DsbL [Legionellaceae bacterium]
MGLLSHSLHASPFVAGKDYQILKANQTTPTVEKPVSVLEFFSYGCPWCYKLNAPLEQWAKTHQKQVRLERVPVVFHAEWRLYAKAYYAAQLLGIEPEMTPALFRAIQDKKEKLDSADSMSAFFIKQGVDEATARSAFSHSPTLELQLKAGLQTMGQYHIQAVPAVVIGQRYKTDLQMAGSVERFFEILDMLLAKALGEEPAEN